MAEMNGNIGTVSVTVGIDLEPSDQFDAVAKMLGYVKKRTCSEGSDFDTSMYGSDARLAEIGELVAAKKPISFLDVTYVPELMCNAEQDYDAMEDGIPDCRIWKCSCGESFPFWRGLNPCFCPNCGAKVVE